MRAEIQGSLTGAGVRRIRSGLLILASVVATNCRGSDATAPSPPTPMITGLSPVIAGAGDQPFTLAVNGTEFTSASAVRWNGTARPTVFVSPTELHIDVTAADIAQAGKVMIDVIPSTGGPPVGPAEFRILSRATPLSASWSHTCGLGSGGVAYCWGQNAWGEIGNGEVAGGQPLDLRLLTPSAVHGAFAFVSIGAGEHHSCGLTAAGQVYCWGSGSYGAGSSFDNMPVPTLVQSSEVFTGITTGLFHTCALNSSGQVFCWGTSCNGSLGTGRTDCDPVYSPLPVQQAGVRFKQVVANEYRACALSTTGVAYCWGSETGAPQGPAFGNSWIPVPVTGGPSLVTLAVGASFACGLDGAGHAYCWGQDVLGAGARASSSTPVAVSGGHVFSGLVAGLEHACGLTFAGQTFCWGYNDSGELGDGTTTDRWAPVAVTGAPVFAALAGGTGEHTCGLTASGQAYCWGAGSDGQLGTGRDGYRISPIQIASPATYTDIQLGGFLCGTTTSGPAYCWGYLPTAPWPNTDFVITPRAYGPPNGGMFDSISVGDEHACGLTHTGQAYCWGHNQYPGSSTYPLLPGGQLGDGTTTDRSTPVAVVGGLTFSRISAGLKHTCALTPAGEAYCWGVSLGQPASSSSYNAVPVRVAANLQFKAIGVGSGRACGLTLSGAAYCWGALNAYRPWPVPPTPIPGGLTFADIAIGDFQICGVTTAGAAYCWDNTLGVPAADPKIPSPVPGGLLFKRLVGHGLSFCGLTANGAAYCWGDNQSGQLGIGKRWAYSPAPTLAGGGLAFTRIGLGAGNACGVTAGGQAYCWGGSYILDGVNPNAVTPQAVAGGVAFRLP